jgi:hypothetical protein
MPAPVAVPVPPNLPPPMQSAALPSPAARNPAEPSRAYAPPPLPPGTAAPIPYEAPPRHHARPMPPAYPPPAYPPSPYQPPPSAFRPPPAHYSYRPPPASAVLPPQRPPPTLPSHAERVRRGAAQAAVLPQAAPPRPGRGHARLQTEITDSRTRTHGPRNYRVWIGAADSETQARWEWERLLDRHPHHLATVAADAEYVVPDRGEAGWRIYAGRFDTMAAASAFCAELRLDDRAARCIPYRDKD